MFARILSHASMILEPFVHLALVWKLQAGWTDNLQDGDTALQITQRRRDPADVVAVTKEWQLAALAKCALAKCALPIAAKP